MKGRLRWTTAWIPLFCTLVLSTCSDICIDVNSFQCIGIVGKYVSLFSYCTYGCIFLVFWIVLSCMEHFWYSDHSHAVRITFCMPAITESSVKFSTISIKDISAVKRELHCTESVLTINTVTCKVLSVDAMKNCRN